MRGVAIPIEMDYNIYIYCEFFLVILIGFQLKCMCCYQTKY
jgi:hypothetical protein